ncbi:twin-arginine translocation signal domain-containing protein [Ellagibacter isourolithinifaciens]|uniref:twin-arginine translocation signal domain-containing protein n=1 Tax=Ellagibacter isourolithinifaciens TaxID=2137581 RepID=UPI003AB0C898
MEDKERTPRASMTRRSFAKLSALAGAAGAVGLAAHGSLTETDQAFAQSGVERVKTTPCATTATTTARAGCTPRTAWQ